MLVQVVDWRNIFWCLAVLSILSGLLIYAVVPERRDGAVGQSVSGKGWLADLKPIYFNSYFWRLSSMVFLHNGVFLSYQALWAAPWLRDVAGLDRAGVAESMLMFNIGMFFGVLSIGVIAERLQKRGIPTAVPATVGICISIVVQSLFAAEWTAFPALLCLMFGFFGSSSSLGYAVLNQKFPAAMIGRVNTAHNMLTFIAAFATQWLVGVIIGLFPLRGPGLYSPEGHQAALIVFICVQISGLLFFLWPRRSGGKG